MHQNLDEKTMRKSMKNTISFLIDFHSKINQKMKENGSGC